MGDHQAVAAATNEEVRQLGESMNRNIQALATTVESVLLQTTTRRNISQPRLPGEVQMRGTSIGLGYGHLESNTLPFQVGSPQNNGEWNSQMTIVSHQPFQSGSAINCASVSDSGSGSCRRSASAPPLPGVSIPSLGRAPGAWRRALEQWTEVDPQTGLALKDWPAKWYRGLMKDKTGSLRSQRQVIFEEYER
jgi:hypothetical protein